MSDDLISRQAAIDALNEVSEHYTDKGREWHPHVNFMVEAIEALPSAQPNLQPTCNQLATDCISRQAAIDALMEWEESSVWDEDCIKHRGEPYWVAPSDVIEQLPSAQRKGKWIYLNGLDAFECSVCGRQMVRNIFDYCPWCGAEMTKGEEDE